MKRFILSTLTVAIFFLGVGTLIEKTTAKFKSDDRALELIRKARQALGGDATLANIRSLRISGHTTKIIKVDGVAKTHSGDTELTLSRSGVLSRSDSLGEGEPGARARTELRSENRSVMVTSDQPGEMKIRLGEGHGEGMGAGTGTGVSEVHVMIKKDDGTVQELTGADAENYIKDHQGDMAGERRIFLKKEDGTISIAGGDGQENGIVIRKMGDGNATFERRDGGNVMFRHPAGTPEKNGLLRLTLGLLMSSPDGMDVDYTYGGEGDIDGTACNIVVASAEGTSYKIFLSKSSDLPIALGYSGPKEVAVTVMARVPAPGDNKGGASTFNTSVAAPPDGSVKTMVLTADAPEGNDVKGNVLFKRAGETVDYLVKFSDYRSMNGVQLPFKWTTTAGNDADETFEVMRYEINPADAPMKTGGLGVVKLKTGNDH
ncbi:MAG: hypothetical protein JO053_15050 [Acidobacteria bacterium]|nr:hypothetical protein [Acidobacteriota bacterium]